MDRVTNLPGNLRNEKATDLDVIPAFILKTAAEEITSVLTKLPLDPGEIPDEWRNAWVGIPETASK